MASKEEPKRGTVGNAHRRDEPLRNWSMPSYSAADGRAASSLAEAGGKDGYDHAENVSAQIPTGFAHIDKRRTTDPRPVSKREFTKVVE
jgi:hypothetical protein